MEIGNIIEKISEDLIEVKLTIGENETPPVRMFKNIKGGWEISHCYSIRRFLEYMNSVDLLNDLEEAINNSGAANAAVDKALVAETL